jgi:four helix bundle protein
MGEKRKYFWLKQHTIDGSCIEFCRKMINSNLKDRTFRFALAIANLIQVLPNNTINKTYGNQLVRCSSAVGANFRASQRAKSDKDFINKLKIVEEEADESVYFLELLQPFNKRQDSLFPPLIKEGNEILKIIAASINTTRKRLANNNNSNNQSS